MTLAESQRVLYHHNDTITRLERASRHAFSYAMGVAVAFGGLLCLLNVALFVCLCKKARRLRSYFSLRGLVELGRGGIHATYKRGIFE